MLRSPTVSVTSGTLTRGTLTRHALHPLTSSTGPILRLYPLTCPLSNRQYSPSHTCTLTHLTPSHKETHPHMKDDYTQDVCVRLLFSSGGERVRVRGPRILGPNSSRGRPTTPKGEVEGSRAVGRSTKKSGKGTTESWRQGCQPHPLLRSAVLRKTKRFTSQSRLN